ncbi:MAG: IMP cyclohydrolase [bacterium]
MKTDQETAAANLKSLFANPYPGRGIVVGRDESDNLIQIYWIMGRSVGSRGRIFCVEGCRVHTEQTDPSAGGDTSLIIYNAMRCQGNQHVVSNGKQTDDIILRVVTSDSNSEALFTAMSTYQYEPDAPNFTPRIGAIVSAGHRKHQGFHLAMNRKVAGGDFCEYLSFSYPDDHMPLGLGRMITTYAGDGNPLPPFVGEPLLVPLQGDIEEILTAYWFALNEANRVSIAVKVIDPYTGNASVLVRNKYEKIKG